MKKQKKNPKLFQDLTCNELIHSTNPYATLRGKMTVRSNTQVEWWYRNQRKYLNATRWWIEQLIGYWKTVTGLTLYDLPQQTRHRGWKRHKGLLLPRPDGELLVSPKWRNGVVWTSFTVITSSPPPSSFGHAMMHRAWNQNKHIF